MSVYGKGLLILQILCYLQASQYDAVIVGAARLLSVIFAASSMDKAGRKILLYASGTRAAHSPPTPCTLLHVLFVKSKSISDYLLEHAAMLT